MQHLIMGAGPAGVIAAESIRQYDASSTVTMVGEEFEKPYSRTAIPRFLSGQIDEDGIHLRRMPGHFAARSIDVRKGRVTGLDREAAQVELESGERLEYDRLLIATGSHPVIPDIPGMDLPGVVNCWTLSDAREIAAHCSPDSRLVIYGAGFLGCVILDAVAQTGAHLTIIEPKARLVQSLMDENSSGLIRDWCTSRGIDIVTSSDILEVESSRAAGGNGSSPGRSLYVVLENGGVYAADMVISTIGQESNTGFLAGSGIAVEQGVLVNDLLQTNDPRVFAAGDVCQSPNFSTGERRIQSLQLATEEHGRIAAANMCGKNIKYPDRISMSVLDTLGLVSGSFGLWMGVDGGESAHLVDRDRFRYLNLQFRDDVLVGASTLGFTDYIGLLPGLIQSQVPLNHWKKRLLADPSRVIELVASQPLCESA